MFAVKQSRMRFRRVRVVAIGALAAAALPVGPSAESLEIPSRIYFKQGKNIVGVNPDGSNRALVVAGGSLPGSPLDPAISPNGQKIALSSAGHLWAGGDAGIRKITRRVSNNLNLTTIRYPAWSPDNKKLVFQATRKQNGVFTARFYRINVDGTGIKQLIKFGGHFSQVHTRSDWSSTNEIAYEFQDDLWVINPDGSGKTNITQDSANYYEPSWNPAGDKIAVIHEGPSEPGQAPFDRAGLWAVDRATGNVSAITGNAPNTDTRYESVSWSPSGNQVAFSGFVEGDTVGYTYDLYVVAATGGAATDLNQSTPTRTTHVLTPDWAKAPPT